MTYHLYLFQIFDDSDQTFIVEVFSEIVRYASLMQVVLDGFYAKDGKKTLRSEQNLYTGSNQIFTLSAYKYSLKIHSPVMHKKLQ
jgi:hypothetical protein